MTTEQHITTKDGRKLYKTDNGFTCWLDDGKNEPHVVSDAYYQKARLQAVDLKKTTINKKHGRRIKKYRNGRII